MPPKNALKAVDTVPALHPDGDGYEEWKGRVKDWCRLSRCAVKERGLTIRMSLTGKAREACQHLDYEQLEAADGVDTLLDTLDDTFLADKDQREFDLYQAIYSLKRNPSVSVITFLNEFDILYQKYKAVHGDLKHPGYCLLLACNLNKTEGQIVRAGCQGKDKSYKTMKATLKSIYSSDESRSFGSNDDDKGTEQVLYSDNIVKQETHAENSGDQSEGGLTLYNKGNYRSKDRSQRGDKGSQNRNRRLESRSDRYQSTEKRKNRNGPDGKPLSCLKCNSTYHFYRDCPDKEKTDNFNFNRRYQRNRYGNSYQRERETAGRSRSPNRSNEVNLSYFVGCAVYAGTGMKTLMEESFGYGLLNSGCVNTVCGEEWMQNYMDRLSVADKEKVRYKPSKETFTFGDGQTVKSGRKITIPIRLGGRQCEITTDVVKCNIPLLVSRRSMTKMRMVLDFDEHFALLKAVGHNEKQTIELKFTNSGHYALPMGL